VTVFVCFLLDEYRKVQTPEEQTNETISLKKDTEIPRHDDKI
jgi:hypothetical protein